MHSLLQLEELFNLRYSDVQNSKYISYSRSFKGEYSCSASSFESFPYPWNANLVNNTWVALEGKLEQRETTCSSWLREVVLRGNFGKASRRAFTEISFMWKVFESNGLYFSSFSETITSLSIFWFPKGEQLSSISAPLINYPIERVNWPWNCSLIFFLSLLLPFLRLFDCHAIMIRLSFYWVCWRPGNQCRVMNFKLICGALTCGS